MIRHALSVAALACAAPAFAQAQPDSATLAAAERFVEVTQVVQQLEQTFVVMAPVMAQQAMAQLGSQQTTRAMFEEITKNDYARKQKLQAIFAEEFLAAMRTQMPRYKREYAREYAASFTKAELDSLNTIFGEGAGAKYIAQTPAVQTRLIAVGQRIGMEVGMVALPKAMQRAKTELDAETTK
jgi:hypothetical protein